jgi:sec-independent protein translocase protein TatC
MALRRGPQRPKLKTPDDVMTLTDHLGELRVRIIRSALAITLFAILIIAFYDPVLDFLMRPYEQLCESKPPDFCGASIGADGQTQLFNFDPIEGLATRIRIGMYGGLILATPVVLWQVWQFIVPALHRREKRLAVPFIVSSVLLFLLGGFLAYMTLEKALEFLVAWSGENVTQAFQVSKYVRLVMLMIGAFGIGLQFPILLVFLQIAGVLTPRQLVNNWRYALLAIVVIAAVITPSGDPISLAALAIPMTLLYILSIGIGWIVQRRRRKEPVAAAAP